jgi:hypothetical protein
MRHDPSIAIQLEYADMKKRSGWDPLRFFRF